MKYVDPKETLKQLFLIKKNNINYFLKKKDFIKMTGLNKSTVYRHLSGEFAISRDSAIRYAKALNCDPAEILFKKI
mgnify:FL=1